MANTYSQLYVHIVFSVKNREHLINSKYKEEIHKYISGIAKQYESRVLKINCMTDHSHILLSFTPNHCLSEIVRVIKADSSRFINENNFIHGKFQWQEGYAAFTYSRSQIDSVANYIHKQEEHHKKRTFHEEYIELLKKFEISYDKKYVFDLL
jgi:putative transposase